MKNPFDLLAASRALTRLAVDVDISPPAVVRPGRITIVGAGPGDPELLTVKASRLIQSADVIVYDRLVGRPILKLARPDAEMIFVGKSRNHHSMPQADINRLLILHAQRGQTVVRLKGGDPFIFGRGGEEMEAARAAGIEVEIVPGITAALGCAAQAEIPLTHRDHASSVTFVAGQCRDLTAQNWAGLGGPGRTLVIYMGLNSAADIAAKLTGDGLDGRTPVAVIENGTRSNARVARTDLNGLADTVNQFGFGSPALLVVGDVATYARANVTDRSVWDVLLAAE